MDDLIKLAKLIHTRNLLEREITATINRPAAIGHIGEYIASRVFNIVLEESASHKGSDGYFKDEPFSGKTVNIKWYSSHQLTLDITLESLPDYYLVLTGSKLSAASSRGQTHPWTIENVFLFNAQKLVGELKSRNIKIGIATSVQQYLWKKEEIYPENRSVLYQLSINQREALALFATGK